MAKALEDMNAAIAVLNAEVGGCGAEPFSEADPLAGLAGGCLDILAGAAGVQARISGLMVNAAGTYADKARAAAPPEAPVQAQEMAIAAEIGALLSLSDRAAGALLAQSHALTTSLPRTLAALHHGTLSWQHATVMVDETATLDPAGAAALEAHFLGPDAPRPATAASIGEMPAYRFKAKARTWRERHHAESIEKRHAKGVLDRRVEYRPDQDGMAWLSAYLPADQASAAWNRLTALARGLQGPDEGRTLTQLRADIFSSAILVSGTSSGTTSGGTASGGGSDCGAAGDGVGGFAGAGTDAGPASGIRAQVLVTVPVFSLMGLTDEPAVLDGYGPIPPSMARQLVAEGAGSFYRVLVDPWDGAPLEIGRTNYRVSTAMRNWLRLRDGKCPFPGCNNNSLDNEADHLLAWHHGGSTGVSNLGQPCPKHHRLRHTSGWKPTPASKTEPPGWTSPTGRHYKSEHQDWEPPHWPHHVLTPPLGVTGGPPDFIYTRLSPGEDGLEGPTMSLPRPWE
ncbi:Endonuclease [Arthrobacter sp. 9AX]|nr:Endonuclease [Arthrobacter sp. 9AX]